MARPISVPYDEIMAKYQTGQYSISKLAKEYNVGKSRLSEYINKNNVRVSEQAIHTINTLNSGFSALQKMVSEQVTERPKETQNTELIEYQSNNTLIVNEVIEIVKKKNPQFAKIFQNLSGKILKISNDLLDSGITNTKDLKNITSAMKDINDTLQVIPKPPAFAQQININKENNNINNNKEFVKHIEVEIISNENTNG